MIFMVIQGGLGNQLFQAGFGVMLEKMTGHEVRFLTHSYTDYTYGFKFELESNFPFLCGRQLSVDAIPADAVVIRECDEDYKSVLSLADVVNASSTYSNIVLDGYWSDEKFFKNNLDLYREILTPKPLDDSVVENGQRIKAAKCIGIHVRRHEYGHIGVARIDYYRNALREIRRECGNLPALVFTDEYNVCKHEFGAIHNLDVIRGGQEHTIRDFYYLTQCSHFIASNSTYSGLAAIIGEQLESIVYFPYPICIFNDARLDVDREKKWRVVDGAVRKA